MQSRSWCFTLNNPDLGEDKNLVHDPLPIWKGLRYRLHSFEIGENGTPHFQGFAYFERPVRLAALKKMSHTAHWEQLRGNFEQNKAYCTKSSTHVAGPWIYGDPPRTPKEKGDAEKERWAEMVSLAKADKFDELLEKYPREAVLYKEKFQRVYFDSKEVLPTDTLEHEWVHGPTGTGKSLTARQEHPVHYVKDPQSRWWDGYRHEDVVIIDDFDKYQVAQGGDLKRWLDHYPFQAPIKGSYMMIRPKKIIITSNYAPDEIWTEPETLDPILRRVKVILRE